MKREALTVVGACAIAVPAMAQGPGGLGAPRVGTPTEVDPQGGALASEVLYDSLSIVDDQTYDVATGNAIGRVPLIGDVFDARNADDFYVSGDEGFTITRVTADYISYEGIHPIGVYVRIYSDDAGLPGEVPIHEKLVTDSDISVAPFDDTVIGLEGLRITCSNLCMQIGRAHV